MIFQKIFSYTQVILGLTDFCNGLLMNTNQHQAQYEAKLCKKIMLLHYGAFLEKLCFNILIHKLMIYHFVRHNISRPKQIHFLTL